MVERLRVVLVEDERSSLDRLRRLVAERASEFEIVGEADNGPAAVEVLRQQAPDLVLLDVSLPGFDGFEVLKALEEPPAVIFVTAYDEHAVRAFRANAVDYLLKPVDDEQLGVALAKARRLESADRPRELERVLAALRAVPERSLRRIACRIGDSTFFVLVEDVQYFRAEQGYTVVKTAGNDKAAGKEMLIDTPLAELESRLEAADFVRIHRNTLVNMNHVASLKRWFDGRMKVVLKDGSELSSSRRYADNLRNIT